MRWAEGLGLGDGELAREHLWPTCLTKLRQLGQEEVALSFQRIIWGAHHDAGEGGSAYSGAVPESEATCYQA